jgi:NADH-quinone oxidoreductase subunit E
MYSTFIDEILENHGKGRDELIPILESIQAKYSYLPADALELVAKRTSIPLVDIFGVATFYKAFSLRPRGRHLVSACKGTACHVRGSSAIVDELVLALGVRSGETTEDRMFTLETVNCLGACALGPIVVVDGHYFSNVKRSEVQGILARAREGLDMVAVDTDERLFPLEVSCPRCNHSLIDSETRLDGLPSIRVVASFERMHGSLRLSCLYGSPTIKSDNEIPLETVVNFFCPHCHATLSGATNCSNCKAPMVPMMVRGGGMLQVCSRRGCREHRLDINGVNL